MKKVFIVANWKAHKTIKDVQEWFGKFSEINPQFSPEEKAVIICASFHLLPECRKLIEEKQLNVFLGSQDVSSFPQGAYTGEVTAEQLQGLVTHTIIGHSERRTNFNESDELLYKKVKQAKEKGLDVFYCVQSAQTSIPQTVTVVAYEPVSAIGSGNPDTPENAESVAKQIKEKNPDITSVLYGGSVTAENVHTFTSQSSIHGVLVGGASLDPVSFSQIIQNA